MTPAELADRVLYRDANLVVFDKPAGMPVHAGPSGGPSVEDLLPALRFGLRHVPSPAHRLDHDTSGCLILARHPKARSRLGRLFERRQIGKLYWAIVVPGPAEHQGTIDRPIRKLTGRDGWRMAADRADGQAAVTLWRRCGSDGEHTWLELEPLTGRTHQIRVHLAAEGWPVLGDPVYGPLGPEPGQPMLLHSRRIRIPYWQDRDPIVVEAPPPPALAVMVERCGTSSLIPNPSLTGTVQDRRSSRQR